MPKNIAVLVDGTGKELERDASNVLKLARVLVDQAGVQTFYYDPGVGTQGAPSADLLSRQELVKVLGLAMGAGIYDKIGAAYRFLMDYYEPGDRLFLFGFSRGAYIVRALAGLVGKLGIMERNRANLVPYAVKLYADPHNLRLVNEFSQTFCDRHPDIRFLGLWDTVKSVFTFERNGREISSIVLPRTFSNPAVRIVRHALAIDERRRFFRTNRWIEGASAPTTDVKQVWFAGDHSDVGGGYPEVECGLSKITLSWMIDEAMAAGLLIEAGKAAVLLGAKGPPQPDRRLATPDALAPLHDSLGGWWLVPEWLPKVSRRGPKGKGRTRVYVPLGEPRFIPPGALVHQSVLDRISAGVGYKPPNLPARFTVEPWGDVKVY